MTFSEKLINLRKSNALSQEELAEKLNVSRQAVSKWELGDAIPDSDKIIALSNVFNVTTDYLLKDEIDAPNATIVMYKNQNKNPLIGTILKFISTPVYAFGMLIAWIIWTDFCKYDNGYTIKAMGITSFFVGLLIQCIGFACYYVGKKLNRQKLSPWQIFWNVSILLFMPISMIFTVSFSAAPAPFPYLYNEFFGITLIYCGSYATLMVIAALILRDVLKKKAKKVTLNSEENQTE